MHDPHENQADQVDSNTDTDEISGEDERKIVALFAEDRAALDPGEHFFASLHDDILNNLEQPTVLDGQDVSPFTEPHSTPERWWSRLFSRRPTIAYATLMAIALIAITVWAIISAYDEPPTTSPEELQLAALEQLSDSERAAAEEMAADIEIDPLEGDVLARPDDETDLVGAESFGDLDQMSDDELDRFHDELEKLL